MIVALHDAEKDHFRHKMFSNLALMKNFRMAQEKWRSG